MIVVLVGILAGFFAISISSEYIERDRRDIAGILLLGIKRDDVVKTFPTFVKVRVTIGVCSVEPLTFLIVGVIHIAHELVEFPLEVLGEVIPLVATVERASAGSYHLGAGVVVVAH